MESQGKPVRYDVVVHKANVPLAKGESLGQYTNRLNGDARKYVQKQLNLSDKGTSVYTLEVFSDKAIVDVYQYKEGGPSTYKFYGIDYTRKANGDFEFKELTEVERVTSYEPKASLSITKGKKAKKGEDGDEDGEEEEEEAEELAKKPTKTKKEHAPGWAVATTKNTVDWAGVL